MRPVNSMIEFKQIIGCGTRLCDGKAYFTIYDFVGASKNFKDPDWDGEPEPPTVKEKNGDFKPKEKDKKEDTIEPLPEEESRQITTIKLGGGRSVEIINNRTSFWDASGKPISAKEFIEKLFHNLPNFFKSEEELREIWSKPETRKQLLTNLKNSGYSVENFEKIKANLYRIFGRNEN